MEYRGIDENFSLESKVCLITGGASGIGLATAKLFARKGAIVVLLDLNDLVSAMAQGLSERSMGIQVDLSDYGRVEQAIETIFDKYKKINVVCNIAGFGFACKAEQMKLEEWNKVLTVNLTAAFIVSQCAGRKMIDSGLGGKIINMASQAGVVAIPEHAAYSVSKAGLIALTRSLALEWGPHGINVNSISPTVVLTPMSRDYWQGERAAKHLELIPSRRFAEMDEIAAAALYLASDAANMINGHNLIIDGGFTIN